MSVRALLAAPVLGVLLLALAVPTADARPLEQGTFHDDTVEVFTDLCEGITMELRADLDVHVAFVAHGRDRLAYFTSTVHGTETWTNVETGLALTHVINIVDRDLEVVDNGDGTLTLTVMGAGVDAWYAPDGSRYILDPGQTRYQLLIDDAGTPADPFDDEELELLGIVKGSTGRNDSEGREFCADFAALTT